MRATVLKFLWR